jgi:hypothetical protein
MTFGYPQLYPLHAYCICFLVLLFCSAQTVLSLLALVDLNKGSRLIPLHVQFSACFLAIILLCFTACLFLDPDEIVCYAVEDGKLVLLEVYTKEEDDRLHGCLSVSAFIPLAVLSSERAIDTRLGDKHSLVTYTVIFNEAVVF